MVYAMAAMVLLTVIVGLITLKVRFQSVFSRQVSPKYYLLMEGDNIPENVTKTTRCFNNQFEFPVLFYTVCTLYLSLGIDSALACYCAWFFVALRVVHATIHLSYNHLIHRMITFWLAVIAVIIMWGNLVISL